MKIEGYDGEISRGWKQNETVYLSLMCNKDNQERIIKVLNVGKWREEEVRNQKKN